MKGLLEYLKENNIRSHEYRTFDEESEIGKILTIERSLNYSLDSALKRAIWKNDLSLKFILKEFCFYFSDYEKLEEFKYEPKGSFLNLLSMDFKKAIESISGMLDYYFLDTESLEYVNPGPMKMEVDFPSGKVIYVDNLQTLFTEDTEIKEFLKGNDYIDCSSRHWHENQTRIYWEKGKMVTGYCGNSCPSVIKTPEGFKISQGSWDEEGEYLEDENSLGSICTDLWWYSLMDVEYFKNQFPELNPEDYDIMEIDPGTYLLSHYYGSDKVESEKRDTGNESCTFAEFKKIS